MNFTPFTQLDLTEPLLRAVEDLGFTEATEIQAQSIPLIREGKDMIGRSQTGTGKTLAFGIPAVESVNASSRKVQVLVLCPTRELAMQACAELRKLSRYRPGVRPEEVYGGVSMQRQVYALQSGANVVVGTPGRIMDHMRRGTLKLDSIHLVVLDEADEMLSMGFKEDIETILSETPAERQTVLFSATTPPEILRLTHEFQHNPAMVEIDKKQPSVKAIHQMSYSVPALRKMDALNLLLRFHDPRLAIIFCNTKKTVDELTEYLNRHHFKAEALHGDMKQPQRTQVLSGFKSARTRLLVATDVAARGIDVENIDFVINFDIPQDPEYYIHRIGRTGRAGKSGTAITLCCGRQQQWQMNDIAKLAKSHIEQLPLPAPEEIYAMAERRQLDRILQILSQRDEGADSPCSAMAQSVLDAGTERGMTPRDIIALLLEQQSQPLSDLPVILPEPLERERIPKRTLAQPARSGRKRPRRDGDMSYILLNVGRNQNIMPGNIVGAITQYTGISGSEIGRIDLFDERSIVGVPSEKVDGILEKLRSFKICGQKADAQLSADSSLGRKGLWDRNGGRSGSRKLRRGPSR